jgi:FkbM family methyltransferase
MKTHKLIQKQISSAHSTIQVIRSTFSHQLAKAHQFLFMERGTGNNCSLSEQFGAVTTLQLSVIEYFLTRHFEPGKRLVTLETGVGATTVLFSKYSSRHTVFCDYDGDQPSSVINAVRNTPGFKPKVVSFEFGPTAKNLAKRSGGAKLDIALIGGSRMHPVPEAEYLAISSRLTHGSILILRDIHIPTVKSLFEILREDDSLQVSQILENTAFFWCSGTPLVGRTQSGWWAQRYNAQHFSEVNALPYSVPRTLPIQISFDGWLRELPPFFRRGITLVGGTPTTGGALATMVFDLDRPTMGDVEIKIRAELVPPKNGRSEWIVCEINGIDQGSRQLAEVGVTTLNFTIGMAGGSTIEIKLYHSVPVSLTEMTGNEAEADVTAHQSILVIKAITINDAAQPLPPRATEPEGLSTVHGAVVSFDFRGTPLSFFVHDRHDSIQANHAIGQLYEVEELDIIAKHIRPGARILDIGANIGNHTVWFEKIAKASLVVPFEPQPRMLKHLKLNCTLNALQRVDLSHLGIALGDATARGTIQIADDFNPAGAIIAQSETGQIPIRPGDDLLGEADFDFIKIDVEGAELHVIDGLRSLIGRCRPDMFIEVGNENLEQFQTRIDELSYEVIAEHRRYDVSTNLLVKPKKPATPTAD